MILERISWFCTFTFCGCPLHSSKGSFFQSHDNDPLMWPQGNYWLDFFRAEASKNSRASYKFSRAEHHFLGGWCLLCSLVSRFLKSLMVEKVPVLGKVTGLLLYISSVDYFHIEIPDSNFSLDYEIHKYLHKKFE